MKLIAAVIVKHRERLFVFHSRLKALDDGNWRTYGTKSFVTPSASTGPSVPSSFRLNTTGSEVFGTQAPFFTSSAVRQIWPTYTHEYSKS